MRIALDATPLTLPRGGLRRYVEELVAALAELEPRDEIHLLTDQPFAPPERLRRLPNLVIEPPRGPRFFGKWWSLALPWELRRRRIDVFHGTNFEAPYAPAAPAVVTLHDLSPWKPYPLRPVGSDRVRRRAPWALALARLVVTPTEAIRREALGRFGLSPERVVAVPHGAAPSLAPGPGEALSPVVAKTGLRGPYALYVGDGGLRKNLAGLIAGWHRARRAQPALQLALAGVARGQAPPHADLFVFPEATDAEIRALLSGASAFVYPSLYEGFGLPVVEAMQAGAPVVASDDAALREIAAGAAVHVDARSATELGEALARVIGDDEFADELRRRGRCRAASLPWRLTAERTRAAYVRAASRA